ncbi:L-asparaginase precursor [Raoultella terrigena]|uniref:L-asparaginase n=1 Tax=Raoultella terrigena TaxID=577 RepID=A0A485BD40_RAOTE|nr:L-asparaginase precursor [Raoultella terrigena]
MVVLNDRIGAARFVTKTNANSLDTFKAPEEGYLGVSSAASRSLKRASIRFIPCARSLTFVS